MSARAQVSPEASLGLSQAPTKLLHGVVLQMLLSEMPLHHCVAALDTGFVLTYLLPRACPGFMELAIGLNPPSSCSDAVMGMDGNARRACWSLPPAFCPSWSGTVPCVVSTQPGSSANETLIQLTCPSGTLEPCALCPQHGTGERSHSRATSRASCCSKHTNPPTHVVSLLCQVLFCW